MNFDNRRSQATSEVFDANTTRSSLPDDRDNIELLKSAGVDVVDLDECLENITTNFQNPVTKQHAQDTPCIISAAPPRIHPFFLD